MRIGQTSAIYLASKFTASIIGIFATIYFTRTLGEEVYGYFVLTLALVSWLGILKSVGFGRAIVKRMSEGDQPDTYLISGMAVVGGLTLILSVGIFYFREYIDSYIGQPVAEFVIFLLFASVFSGLVSSGFKGKHKVHLYAIISTTKQICVNILMVFLVFISWGLTGMLIGYIIGTFLVSLVGILIIKPNYNRPTLTHISNITNFAKYSWLGSARKRTFRDIDIIILGVFVPAGLTGIYAVAYSLSKFLDLFGDAIKTTLFPELSRQSADEDSHTVSNLTEEALTYAGLFLIPGIVGASVIGDRLLLIYGDAFPTGTLILVILLIGLVFYTYMKQLLNTIEGMNRPELAFRSNGVFTISNITLNIILVYMIGWVGAAIATSISALIGLVISYHYTCNLIQIQMPYKNISYQWVSAVLMGFIVFIMRKVGEASFISTYNEIFVIILVGIGAIIYFSSLIVLSSDFRKTAHNNLPDIKRYIYDHK